jgi:hypothetical protein
MSTESQSRASLDTPSGGLISQFDLHLRIIADRYLNFFLERSASSACDLIALTLSFTGEGLRRFSELSMPELPLVLLSRAPIASLLYGSSTTRQGLLMLTLTRLSKRTLRK